MDDEGRARASSRMLASLLYPYDEDAGSEIEDWLIELESEHMIRRYTVEGCCYMEVRNWLKHQKIDKPSASRLPAFAEPSRAFVEQSRGVAVVSRTVDLGPGTLDPLPQPMGAKGLIPEFIANELPKKLGLRGGYGPNSLNQVILDVVKIEAESGRDLDSIMADMEAAYRLFEQEKPNLRYAWKPANFFGDGHWRDPKAWPRKEDKMSARAARTKAFMEGSNEGD